MRILLAVGRGKPHLHEQRADPFGQFRPPAREPEGAQRLGHDVAHPPARIEAGIGVLEDHLHPPPGARALGRGQPRQFQPVEQHPAGGRAVEAHNQPRDGGLAAAGLPDKRQRFALRHGEGNAVHGLQEDARALLDGAREPGLRDIEMPRDRLCGDEVSGASG